MWMALGARAWVMFVCAMGGSQCWACATWSGGLAVWWHRWVRLLCPCQRPGVVLQGLMLVRWRVYVRSGLPGQIRNTNGESGLLRRGRDYVVIRLETC
jgi:hypothetical protein